MKDLCGKKIKCKEMSDTTGIPYSTLNDIINGKTDPGQMRFSYAKKMADYLEITLDELYEELTGKDQIELHIDGGEILVRNKSYYLRCQAYAEKLIKLCKVNKTNTYFVRDLAQWKIEELKEEAEWKDVEQRLYTDAQG